MSNVSMEIKNWKLCLIVVWNKQGNKNMGVYYKATALNSEIV